MSFMADLCVTIDKCNARGGKTLSLLHEKCVNQSLASTEKLRDLGLVLTRSAADCYFKILRKWIHRGIIEDPGKDFFVEDNEVIERAVLPLEYSDDYWERRYSIKADQIPAFLHANVDKILRTGKYLNVIQQCEQSKAKKTYYKAERSRLPPRTPPSSLPSWGPQQRQQVQHHRQQGRHQRGSSANTRPNVGDQGLEVSGLQSLREEARPVRLYLDTSSLKDGGDLLGGDGDIIVSENEGGVNAGKLGVGHLLRFDAVSAWDLAQN